MDKKKSPQADLERKRSTFLQTGFVAALALAVSAFAWTEYKVSEGLIDHDSGLRIMVLEEDVVPYHKLKPEVPKAKKAPLIDKFEIVDENLTDEKDKKEELPELDFDFDMNDFGTSDSVADFYIPAGDNGPMNFMAVEQKPYYEDCEDVIDETAEMQCTYLKITRFINSRARYPERAKYRNAQGTVMVNFVINKKGEVEQVDVEESVDKDLDAEAIRVVKSLPRFIPGSQQGRPVKVAYRIPVRFVMK